MRQIYLFNLNFTPLAGLLGVGYFLHPICVPIVRNNITQANNERDICWGYLLVFICYVAIGTFGYFGFMGIYFEQYEHVALENEKPLA